MLVSEEAAPRTLHERPKRREALLQQRLRRARGHRAPSARRRACRRRSPRRPRSPRAGELERRARASGRIAHPLLVRDADLAEELHRPPLRARVAELARDRVALLGARLTAREVPPRKSIAAAASSASARSAVRSGAAASAAAKRRSASSSRSGAARTARARRRSGAHRAARARAACRARRAGSRPRGRAAASRAPLGERERPAGVPLGERGGLARLVEPLARVQANRLEQAVAALARRASSTATSDFSTSRASTSATSGGVEPVAACRRVSTAASSKPPAKTASRRNSIRSSGSSRSWLHWSVAASVCCRVGAAWLPRAEQAEAVVEPLGDRRAGRAPRAGRRRARARAAGRRAGSRCGRRPPRSPRRARSRARPPAARSTKSRTAS